MRETARVFLDAEALTEVRRNTDWAALLAALGIAVDPRRCKADEIWAHSPFAEDRQASFHVTPKGWYCFATGAGGGALELVQRLRRTDCYGAARWLLENGLSRYPGEERTAAPAEAPGQSGEDVPGEVPGLTTPQFLVLHKSS